MTTYEAELSSLTTRRAAWRAPVLLAVGAAAILIPIFVSAMPPVMDFPNHLARIWLLSDGIHTPPLSEVYEARWWQASTNLAVDFIGTLLMQLLGMTATAKILLGAMFIAPPLGAALLNRAVFGRFHAWQLLAITLAWGTTAVEGFLSFQIGLGAALICAAAFKTLPEKPTQSRLASILAIAAGLLLIHPFALLFFAAICAGLAMGEHAVRGAEFRRRCLPALMVGIAALLPLVLMYLLAPQPPGAHNHEAGVLHFLPWRDGLAPSRLALVYGSPLISYDLLLDLVAALPLIALVLWAAIAGRMRTHFGLLLVAAILFVISPLLPNNFGDGGALTIRFPLMGMLLAVSATRPQLKSPRWQTVLTAGVLLVVALRAGTIGYVWWLRSEDPEQLRQAVEPVAPGSPVLVLQQKWDPDVRLPLGRMVAACPVKLCASERHFGALTVPWQQAFIPALFTVPGQQPLGVREPWRNKSVYSSSIPFADEIYAAGVVERDPYLNNWQDKFDYVLLLDSDMGHSVIPYSQLVRDTGFARLYRVVR